MLGVTQFSLEEPENDNLVQMIFLFLSWCILRFHLNLPGCTYSVCYYHCPSFTGRHPHVHVSQNIINKRSLCSPLFVQYDFTHFFPLTSCWVKQTEFWSPGCYIQCFLVGWPSRLPHLELCREDMVFTYPNWSQWFPRSASFCWRFPYQQSASPKTVSFGEPSATNIPTFIFSQPSQKFLDSS